MERFVKGDVVEIKETDFKNGVLNKISYLRPAKLFTANLSLIHKKVGSLNKSSVDKINLAVCKALDLL